MEAGGKRWKGPDPPVSSDQQAIQPSELYEWVRKQTRLRAVGIVEALEEISIAQSWTANQVRFGKPLRFRDQSQRSSATGGDLASGCRSHNSRKPLAFRAAGAAKTGCRLSRGDWRLVR